MLSTRFSRIALLPMLLLSTRGFAQDGSQAREYGPWVWGLQGGAVEQFEAGLAGDSGEFSVSQLHRAEPFLRMGSADQPVIVAGLRPERL